MRIFAQKIEAYKNGGKMNIEEFREHCLSIKGATESLPFLNHNILVFKIMGKMFAYIPLEPKDGIFRADLKCNPEKSIELREKYEGISHTDFKTPLWNLLTLESDVPDDLIKELIQHSADEVIKKLPKRRQEEYRNFLPDGNFADRFQKESERRAASAPFSPEK